MLEPSDKMPWLVVLLYSYKMCVIVKTEVQLLIMNFLKVQGMENRT